jgi:outer membrane protein assembly factor BamB
MLAHLYSRGRMITGDRGRYALTVAEGKVFALGDFIPSLPSQRHMLMRRMGLRGKQWADTSSLAAFSLRGGKRLWQIGHGGRADDLAAYKFLSAPTYEAGRLYVMASHLQSFHLLCLDSGTGALRWDVSVSQMPPVSRRHSHLSGFLERDSPPAVADGRVFALTHAGVIAAFDAETGQPAWAYQYASRRDWGFRGRPPGMVFAPPNPIVVAQGRVICLPADSGDVLALSAQSGGRLWKVGSAA